MLYKLYSKSAVIYMEGKFIENKAKNLPLVPLRQTGAGITNGIGCSKY